MPYFHLVFTVPAAVAAIALQNKAIVYDILFRAAAKSVQTIAADPKHLGAATGMTTVLHRHGKLFRQIDSCNSSLMLAEVGTSLGMNARAEAQNDKLLRRRRATSAKQG